MSKIFLKDFRFLNDTDSNRENVRYFTSYHIDRFALALPKRNVGFRLQNLKIHDFFKKIQYPMRNHPKRTYLLVFRVEKVKDFRFLNDKDSNRENVRYFTRYHIDRFAVALPKRNFVFHSQNLNIHDF